MTAKANPYGLNRDWLAQFNDKNYTCGSASKVEQVPLSAEELRAEKVKQAAREAAARQHLRKKATRTNRPMPMACVPSDESIHRAAIRKELEAA